MTETITKVSGTVPGTENATQVKNLERKEHVSEESKPSKFSRFVRKSKEIAVGTLIGLAIATGAHAQNYTTQGNQILDPNGQVFYIHGIDRSGFETSPLGNESAPYSGNHFTQTDFNNIASWGANTVRIATNQEYLLSDSPCYDSNYLGRLVNAANLAHTANLNVIFDLHQNFGSSTPPANCPTGQVGQQEMADTRSLNFWKQMADQFKSDPKVFFELYNEPNTISWSCWRDSAYCNSPWVGMQDMYNTVRGEGFNNLVIVGGLNWAYDLSGVPNYPLVGVNNVVYATHVYTPNPSSDWNRAFGFLTSTSPVIATEFGEFDCQSTYVLSALNYFDAPNGNANNKMSWTGWAWNAPGNDNDATHTSCSFPSVINDWNGTPNTMGSQSMIA